MILKKTNLSELLEELKLQDYNTFDLEQLYQLLLQYDFAALEYDDEVPVIDSSTNYGRNILIMDPMEAVLIYWPPGVASAIHHHQGF